MAEDKTTQTASANPPPKKPPVPEVDIICLPARPRKPRNREDVVYAKRIASRYLTIKDVQLILSTKRENARKRAATKTKLENPEDFYDQGTKYLTGARCAVPFQEQAAYYQKAAEMFERAGDLNDAPQLAELYTAQAQTTLDEGYRDAYRSALDKKAHAVTENDWFTAARAFERISGYEDADQQAADCETRLQKIHAARRPLTIAAVVLAVLVIFGVVQGVQTDVFRYQAAKALASVGMESTATYLLSGVEYKDSDELMNQIRYEQGLEKMEKGSYSSAASLFGKCEGYADSDTLAQECHFYLAQTALESENYESALNHLLKAWDWEGSKELRCQTEITYLAQLEPGDRMTYGKDEYILLDKTEDHALLLSSKLYGDVPYNASAEGVSWADSDMRAALNGDYTAERFSQAELDLMEETETEDGVTDQVFLLSAAEYLTYQEVMGDKDALWWLRDVNETTGNALFVSCDGSLMTEGYPANTTSIQGRAAFWLSLTAD